MSGGEIGSGAGWVGDGTALRGYMLRQGGLQDCRTGWLDGRMVSDIGELRGPLA